jgi:DinB family protein
MRMTALDLVKLELTRLHASYDRVLDELTPEQLHRVPAGHPKANTIAWGVWHYVRTEDNVVRYILQARRPIVWAEGGYAEKLGLPPVAQGTGMSTAEAQALRLKDLGLFRDYVAKVWASTDEFLARIDPAALDSAVTVKPLGEMPGIRALVQVCVTHGFTHIGEIELARTLVSG